MIPVRSTTAYDTGLAELESFSTENDARGRFIALYLGLRLMGDRMAPLGSAHHTTAGEIQEFMDLMWTKTHRASPLTVLTAPFGRGGPSGGYSTVTGATAPGNTSPTNTWRNNLSIQKGVGCVADTTQIATLITREDPRAACPHFIHNGGGYTCAIAHAGYRGEKQSIWLARSASGFQVVDLDEPSAFEPYLRPNGARIPVFALMAVLYCFAPDRVYPERTEVTVPEFEADFGFTPGFVEITFDCNPSSPANARTIEAAGASTSASIPPASPPATAVAPTRVPLPELPEQVFLNSGIQAEVAVGLLLEEGGWTVYYTAGQRGLGYDLRAESATSTFYIEVKSSVGYVRPVLTSSEWNAATELGDTFVLAVVDFVGTEKQSIYFVRHPAHQVNPVQKHTITYALPRDAWESAAISELPATS